MFSVEKGFTAQLLRYCPVTAASSKQKALSYHAQDSREEYPVNSIVYEGDCPHCGQHFWANKPHAVYCSAKCRAYASKARQQAPLHMPAGEPGNTEPTVVGTGNGMHLEYANPFSVERREMEAQGADPAGWEGMTQTSEIAYKSLLLREQEFHHQTSGAWC